MPPPRPGAEARALIAERLGLARAAARVLAEDARLRRGVVDLVEAYRDDRLRTELAGIEVERLRDTTERNLRLQALADAGVRTVRDVLDAGPDRLESLPGVGPHTARAAVAAAARLADTLRASFPVRIDPRGDGPLGLPLAGLLHRVQRLDRLLAPQRQDLVDFSSAVAVQAERARPARHRLGLVLRTGRTRARAGAALAALAR